MEGASSKPSPEISTTDHLQTPTDVTSAPNDDHLDEDNVMDEEGVDTELEDVPGAMVMPLEIPEPLRAMNSSEEEKQEETIDEEKGEGETITTPDSDLRLPTLLSEPPQIYLPSPVKSTKEERVIRSPASARRSRSSSPADYPAITERSALMLVSLPIDSLHCVASFLSATEWANFGQANKAARKISQEIFRRVRMHGFKCATEVVSAWVSF